MQGPWTAAVVLLASVLLAAALVASLLFDAGPEDRALGAGTAVVGLLGAPLLVVVVYLTQGQFFPLPARYALVLLPLMAVLLARRLTPWSGAAVTGLGLVAVAGTAVQLAVL